MLSVKVAAGGSVDHILYVECNVMSKTLLAYVNEQLPLKTKTQDQGAWLQLACAPRNIFMFSFQMVLFLIELLTKASFTTKTVLVVFL